MNQYDIPDQEERESLKADRNILERVHSDLSEPGTVHVDGVDDSIAEAKSNVQSALNSINDRLADIPEWDGELIRKIVLKQADRSGTSVERLDNEIHFYFEVADYDHSTVECRWATAVGNDSEWFFVKQDGDWEEVWRAH